MIEAMSQFDITVIWIPKGVCIEINALPGAFCAKSEFSLVWEDTPQSPRRKGHPTRKVPRPRNSFERLGFGAKGIISPHAQRTVK